MRYDRAPRPLSAVSTIPPRRVKAPPSAATPAPNAAATRTNPPPAPRAQVIFGHRAVWTALLQQTDNIGLLLYTREQIGALAPVFPVLAARQVTCRQESEETLTRVAGSYAHQGLVVTLKAPVARI